jgi:hypothetical protein
LLALADFNYSSEAWLWLFGTIIVFSFVATLLIVPWIVVHLPTHYFTHHYRQATLEKNRHPIVRIIVLLGKNLLGGILLLVGLAMLILPGQGILTIFMGILMLDFPGKYQSERWLIRKKPILFSVNWLRQKWGRDSLEFD